MSRSKLYVGASGELRTASELSLRGYIVHLPVVDEGGDLWVVTEDSADSKRVQVKTCATPDRKKWPGCAGYQMNVKNALLQPGQSVVFVLHCIHDRVWRTFLLSRDQLVSVMPRRASARGKTKTFWIVFEANGTATLGGVRGPDLSPYRDAWDGHFPVVSGTGVAP